MKNKAASLYPVIKTWLHCTFNLCYLIWGEDIYLKKKRFLMQEKRSDLKRVLRSLESFQNYSCRGEKYGGMSGVNTIK